MEGRCPVRVEAIETVSAMETRGSLDVYISQE